MSLKATRKESLAQDHWANQTHFHQGRLRMKMTDRRSFNEEVPVSDRPVLVGFYAT